MRFLLENWKKIVSAIVYVAAFLFLFVYVARAEVPDNKGRITDYTASLTYSEVQTLASRMKRNEKNGQAAVLLVKTLDNTPITEYAADVFHKWKLGSKEKNDGILLLIVVQDRKVRIETGYGTEGKVVDIQAFDIITKMKPHLAKNDWYRAIDTFITETNNLMNKE